MSEENMLETSAMHIKVSISLPTKYWGETYLWEEEIFLFWEWKIILRIFKNVNSILSFSY